MPLVADNGCGCWICFGVVVAQASGRELTIFCNEWLEKVTGGKFRACRHRVATQPNTPRLSMLYELRLHRERWVDGVCDEVAPSRIMANTHRYCIR